MEYQRYLNSISSGDLIGMAPPHYFGEMFLFGLIELFVGLAALSMYRESLWLVLLITLLPFIGLFIGLISFYFLIPFLLSFNFGILAISIPFQAWFNSDFITLIAVMTVVELFVILRVRDGYDKRAINRQSFQKLIDWSMGH